MTSFGSDFVLTLFTNDAELARQADLAGINRIGLDLERIGKRERQGSLNTWISDHSEEQLPAVRAALRRARLFVRTNPIHPGIREEIDRLIDCGAEVLMLPMFRTAREAAEFIGLIAGRAQVSLLVETAAAAVRIGEIVALGGIDEIHIGLNDLRLDLGLTSHFELLTYELIEMLSGTVVGAGIPFGFGGIARLDDGRLPIPADLVYAQYPRLNADRALVSRVFTTPRDSGLDLVHEVAAFRRRMDHWHTAAPEELDRARRRLAEAVGQLP